MKKTYFSRRLYKEKLTNKIVDEISYVVKLFNKAKRFTFQTLVREKRWDCKMYDGSIHLVVKKKFGLND